MEVLKINDDDDDNEDDDDDDDVIKIYEKFHIIFNRWLIC